MLYVDHGGVDVGNVCTVRSTPCRTIGHAISEAETTYDRSDAVTIDFAGGNYPENATINASGLASLTIRSIDDGRSVVTVTGQGEGSVFTVDGGTVEFDHLSATGGRTLQNGG